MANPAIPESVKKENIDPMPVTLTSHTATKTTQRMLSPSRTLLIRSADAPALLAPLVMSLISISEISQEAAMLAASSPMKITVSTNGVRSVRSEAAHIQMSSTLSAIITLRFDKP